MKLFALIFTMISILIFASSTFAQRIGSSQTKWKTLKTENFDIVFTAEHQDLGLYYAEASERAMAELSTVFSYKPRRTVIVINDTTDVSNGFATRIPYPYIMAYSVPIGDHESLAEAGDWAHELIVHELTHILQLEPAQGFYKFLRPVFGTIVAPNMLLPLWWKEGMAVEMETQFSAQGRLRSTYQDATLRALVLDQKLFKYTLPQANEVLPSWPYGSRPYLFGSIFWSSLVKDSTIKAADHLTIRHGQRIPYAIEEPMRELVNRNYEAQYTKGLHEAELQAQKQIQELSQLPFTNVNNLETSTRTAQQPRWSENLQLLATIENTGEDESLFFYDVNKKRVDFKNRPTGTIGYIDFHPQHKKIYYTQIRLVDKFNNFADIFEYDLETQKSKPLTTRERAREISVSPNGKKIVFISTVGGRTLLKLLDLDDNSVSTLKTPPFSERWGSPLFWSNSEVLFTIRNSQGRQTLQKYDTVQKNIKALDLPYEQIRFLRRSTNEGEKSLYFVSTENGVQNVYVSNNLKTAKPVTHLSTGSWSFDVDEKRKTLYMTRMTGEGFKISSSSLTRSPASLPKIKNENANRYKFNSPKINYANSSEQKIEDYSGAGYLWPTYWIPFVASSSSSKGIFFQAQTSGHDPIHIHDYTLVANYDSELQKGGFAGSYTNSSLAWPVQASAVVRNQAFGDETQIVETKTGALGVNPDLFSWNKNLLLQIGAEYQETDLFGSQTKHWGPYFFLQYTNYEQTIFDISPDNGWGTFIKYENKLNIQDSRDYNKVTSSFVGYFSPWLPEHHVFMTRLSSLLTFESISARFGSSNSSLFLQSDSIVPQFVLRGYQPSQFFGRSLWNFNFEYRFPVQTIERGSGTDGYFLKRLSGALIADGLGVEGASVAEDNTVYRKTLNESFWASGAELKLETTLGYILPVNFVFGVYLPHSPLYSSSVQTGISLQISGF